MSGSEKTSSSGSWRSLLSSIASFRGDLSTLTAPPFILSPTSQLEYTQYWYPGHDVFVAPDLEADPAKRFLLVLKWVIACNRASYTQRNVTEGYEKKPLNPFLGELFEGKWPDSGATLAAEQVSHHPPASAFKISTNEGVSAEGYVAVRARFSSTICVSQTGHTVYRLDNKNETYVVGLPALHVEGFLTGAPFLELDGKVQLQSSTGYTAIMHFSGAGYLTGKKHTVKITVFKTDAPKEILYTIKGQWHKTLTIKDEKTGAESEFSDLTTVTKLPELDVRPIEEQHPNESRRAWSKVSAAIRKGDNQAITQEKSKIENEQREQRKKEEADGTEWQRRWFDPVAPAKDPYVQYLEKLPDGEIWRFNQEKYSKDADFSR